MNILIRTFLAVFPRTFLFRGDFSPGQPALALISTHDGATFSSNHLDQRLSEFSDPANPHVRHPISFWMHFTAALDRESFSATTQLNRESRPLLELSSPLQHAGARTSSLLVGRKLQSWLTQFQQAASTQKFLSLPHIRDGMTAGNHLAEMTLLLSEGRPAQAAEAQKQLKLALPATVYAQFFP